MSPPQAFLAGAAGIWPARADRVRSRLELLFELGEGPHAHRPGIDLEEEEACQLAAGWMREAGLTVELDSAGNVTGRLAGNDPGVPEIWTGSHLDSVPAGGRFDGALGVVAAIESVGALQGRDLRASVVVAAFRDEEGWRFGNGLFGSRSLTGSLTPGELEERDSQGVTRGSALRALGHLVEPPGAPPARAIGRFVELHIEQGPVLAEAGEPIGIVSEIVGMSGFDVVFTGAAGHAGTTPMEKRADAFAAAATMALELRAAALAIDGTVATIGAAQVSPGASNVVPGRVALSVDVRAPDDARLARLETAVADAAIAGARATGCSEDVRRQWRLPAAPMNEAVRAALRAAASKVCGAVPELVSGAGHDAQTFVAAGVKTGMLFTRSLAGGVSHAPEEETDVEAIAVAIAVLSEALAELADGVSAPQ